MNLKLTIVISFIFLLCFSAKAQFTINADTSFYGDSVHLEIVQGNTSIDISANGPNQTWDLSGITGNDTISMTIVKNTDALHNDANYKSIKNNTISYLTISENFKVLQGGDFVLSSDGFGINDSIDHTTDLSDPKTIMKYPFNYTDSITDSIVGDLQYYNQSNCPSFCYSTITPIWWAPTQKLYYDAYGTLKLPNGNFNVARITETVNIEVKYNGCETKYQGTNYYFYIDNYPLPILSYFGTKSSSGGCGATKPKKSSLAKISYIKEINLPTNLLENTSITNNSVNIYPNPTNNITYISFNEKIEEKLSLKILNATGQVVFEKNEISANKGDSEQINVNHLSAGIYYIQIIGNSHFINKKLIIK